MKIDYIKLKNFSGIYNGIGEYELEIDFTKSRNNIILINGRNGSGKSTLLNSLHPFAGMYDNCSNEFDYILPNENGVKEIIISQNKKRYRLLHEYTRNNRTKTFTVKSYFQKLVKAEWEELNPGGKQVLFNELVLKYLKCEPGIMAITKLGNNVNSFISRKSTERKEYITQFLPHVEEYLEFYKVISKKLTNSKAVIKTIATQLDKLGSQEEIEKELASYTAQFENFRKQKDEIIGAISKIEGKLEVLNAEETMEKMNSLVDSIKALDIDPEIEAAIDSDHDYQKLFEKARKNSEENGFKQKALMEALSKWETKMTSLQEKLKSAQDSSSLASLQDSLERLKNRKTQLEKDLKKYQPEENNLFLKLSPEALSEAKYKFIALSRTVSDLTIDLKPSWNEYFSHPERVGRIGQICKKAINCYQSALKQSEELSKTIAEKSQYLPLVETLKKRPKTCGDDNCPFISQALKYSKLETEIGKLRKQFNVLEKELEENKADNERQICLDKIITGMHEQFKKDFNKYFTSFVQFVVLVDIEKITSVIDSIQSCITYSELSQSLASNALERDSVVNRIKALQADKNSLQSLSEELEKATEEYDKAQKEYEELVEGALKWTKRVKRYRKILETIEAIQQRKRYKKEIKSYKDSYLKIKDLEKDKESEEERHKTISEALETASSKKEDLQVRLGQIKEFIEKEKELKKEYDKLEILKDTLSPIKGIPLLFISQFLNRTRKLTNRLLANVYEGAYKISEFVLNDKEFAIKISKQDRGEIPDIRRCSAGEQSMTGISLSLALIQQSMTDYNILCLDEMDSELDDSNRQSFIDILNKQLLALGIDQCFIISHNQYFNDIQIDTIEFPDSNIENSQKTVLAKFE